VKPGDHRINVVDRQAKRIPQGRRMGRHIHAFQHQDAKRRAIDGFAAACDAWRCIWAVHYHGLGG
jgi:hypothetical protein